MNRLIDLLLVCIAASVALFLAFKVMPVKNASGTPGSRNDYAPYYHPGKNARKVSVEGNCISDGCHPGAPHKREPALAPFRNMHSTFIECMVCHAPDGSSRFDGRHAETGRRHLRYTGNVSANASKGHPVLGSAGGCRRCHSEAGAKSMKERGLPSLPSSFADPIALRMQEGGGRGWNP